MTRFSKYVSCLFSKVYDNYMKKYIANRRFHVQNGGYKGAGTGFYTKYLLYKSLNVREILSLSVVVH